MSRVKLLLDVVEDIRSLADSLQAVADALGQSDTDEVAAPDPALTAHSASAPTDPPPKAITLEEVRAVLAEKLSGVDSKHYAALLKDAEVLGHAT